MTKQWFTKGEELANSILHGLEVVFAVVALVLMLASANNYGLYSVDMTARNMYI